LDTVELGAACEQSSGALGVPFLRFAEDAQEVFAAWRDRLEQRLRSGQMQAGLNAHLAKYRGLIPRLALICHIGNRDEGPVTLEATRQALAWADYLESHASRVYASLSLDNADAARAIWRRVKKGDLPQPFTARDIQQKGWSRLNETGRIASGLEALCDVNWLRADRLETGGRPSIIHRVNPKALSR
jgi:hypothetical protein